MVTGDDCGASACGQALQFRLLRFRIELCCCCCYHSITCGNGNAVVITGDDCGASACGQALQVSGGTTCGNGNAVVIAGDDCGASACGQALRFRLLRFQIEPCCCYSAVVASPAAMATPS